MNRLSTDTLKAIPDGVETPRYDRQAAKVGIVHFGIGAFHQAHQAVFTDDAMAASGGDWSICGVSLNSRGSKDRLGPQDGLYSLAICDKSPSTRIIGAVKEVLFAGESQDAVLERLCAPTTKFVTLTITEKGYALSGEGQLDLENPMIKADIENPETPSSAMGYIVLASQRRKEAGHAPLTMMSCDNLPANGDKLRGACVSLAQKTNPDLAGFIKTLRFPNTMVDSITPATNEEVLETVRKAIGLDDKAAVQRETFAQWVIEDDLPEDRPDWTTAGATITKDVHGFEMTKLRILNGAHSTLTYLGLLANLKSVEDTILQAELRSFVDSMIRQETISTIDAPQGLDLEDYWARTIARFENPHIRHLIEQISHDGSQKIPARIVPVILHHLKAGKVARHACFVVAAWIVWNQTRRADGNPPTDAYLHQTKERLPSAKLSLADYVDGFLNRDDIFPNEFQKESSIRASIHTCASEIKNLGVLDAAKQMVGEKS